MDNQVASLLDYAARLHACHDHPASPTAFARALGIRLIPGLDDSSNGGPPAIITYDVRYGLNRRRFTLWHELAHVVMAWHGIDAEYEAEWGEAAHAPLENLANLVAGLFMVPRPVMAQATERYGLTAGTVMHLAQVTKLSEAVCIRRFAFDDLNASRAAALFYGPYVADVATLNYRLPFERYSRVPEPGLIVPDASLRRVRGSRVIGVWEG